MPVYLDCAATTPIDPRVLEVCVHYLRQDFGNAASRTHSHGTAARKAVEHARDQIAAVTGASRGGAMFTSGATESTNLALSGVGRRPMAGAKPASVPLRAGRRRAADPCGCDIRRPAS